MKPTAVILDDSSTTRAALRLMLGRAGFDVVAEGVSGDQALSLYESHRPTVITIDIVLPGLDGVSAATELLRLHPDATVVMCSSISARDKILACRDAGATHFILKPITWDKVEAVSRVVMARAARLGLDGTARDKDGETRVAS